MKLIFSRKGFDSSAGGGPSPILPDGRLLSLPIPDAQGRQRMGDLLLDGQPVSRMVHQLSRGRIRHHSRIHLDPDLLEGALARRPRGWRPAFGQHGAAQGHLRSQQVGEGDLFLFFGWFRQAERHRGRWRFCPDAADQHVLFGWLRVGQPLSLQAGLPARWAGLAEHAHCHLDAKGENCLYVAAPQLGLSARSQQLAGAGLLARWHRDLCLTGGARRGQWHMPLWFWPSEGRQPLSFHQRPERWRHLGDCVQLELVHRGQEFVLDCEQYPEAPAWAEHLLLKHAHATSLD